MPPDQGTLTPEDVAAELGVPVDVRMERATAAARAWGQRRRSLTDPQALWAEDNAHLGGVLYAALLYQSRTTPSGLSGYDEEAAAATSIDALYRARELVGQDLVIA